MNKVLRSFLILLNLLLLIPYCCVAIFLPLYSSIISIFSTKAAMLFSTFFAESAWRIFSNIFNLQCTIDFPDILKTNTNYLIISNHIGSMDFMVLNEIAIKHGMLRHLKYLIKNSALYIPVFGLGMKACGFLFLKRDIKADEKMIINHCKMLKTNKIPIWLVVYPEGTRFTQSKKERSNEYCEKNGLPMLENVLFPRYGGFKLVIENIKNSGIDNLVSITSYFQSKTGSVPSLQDFLLGRAKGTVKTDIKVTPISEIYDHKKFLCEDFLRKDRLIRQWKIENISSSD